MNKLIAVVLFCCSLSAQSKSWNEIFAETEGLQFESETPMLINNTLVFKGVSNEKIGLWSYDTVTNQLINLIPADENHYLNDMVQLGETVYFLLQRPSEEFFYKLWKTDGSLAGTSLISDIEFRRGFSQPSLFTHKNTLFARGDDGAILEFDGNQLFSHDVQMYDSILRYMCLFGPQDLITYDNNDLRQIVRVTENQTSDLSAFLPEGYVLQSLVDIDKDCYIHFTEGYDNNAPFGILKVSQSGETLLFSDSENLQNIHQVFVHKNQKFAFRKNSDESKSSSLVSLTNDDIVSSFEFTLPDGNFTTFTSTKSQLLVNFQANTYINYHYSFDDALNPLLFRTGPFLGLPKHYPSLDTDTLVSTDISFDIIGISSLNINGQQASYQSQGFGFYHAISSDSSNNIYFTLKDKNTGITGIYVLNNQPKIGILLNGIWADPQLANQGLFIKQGVRANGSKYIFATMYTYRNGQPLWLAGVENFTANQDAIEVNLSDFQGLNLLEPNATPIQNIFGTVHIKPNNCDNLTATVTHNNELFELSLSRIDDRTYEHYCLSQID